MGGGQPVFFARFALVSRAEFTLVQGWLMGCSPVSRRVFRACVGDTIISATRPPFFFIRHLCRRQFFFTSVQKDIAAPGRSTFVLNACGMYTFLSPYVCSALALRTPYLASIRAACSPC